MSLLVFLLSSCIIKFVGITNEYDNLMERQKSKIKQLVDFASLENEYIYELTGPQLLEELSKHDKSLVYYFVNGCKSEYCLPLQTVVNYAADFDYKLFLIMNHYGRLQQTQNQNIDIPLFAINSNYYNANKTRVYTSLFKADIGLTEFLGDNKYGGGYLFYKKNKLVDVKKKLILVNN